MDSSQPIVVSTETVNESHYSAEFKNNMFEASNQQRRNIVIKPIDK